MIAKVTRGADVGNLLRYLYGPGKRNEHVDPHIVAGYRHPAALEPVRRADGKRDLRPLAEVLRSPLETMRRSRPKEPVWQCSLRTAPTDRALTDEEWTDVAEELMHQTGIAPRGDAEACRWIAVRHADDHIHVVATLAREDGRRPNVTRDYLKARTACQIVERRYGLFRTAPADRTAAPRPSRAELERAERAGLEEPPRVSLRRQVATAAAVAESEDAFFVGLRERGLLVRLRFSVLRGPALSGQLTDGDLRADLRCLLPVQVLGVDLKRGPVPVRRM
ncbi:relaxase/mobilization nuclease domain-containing protein, partial [Actinomadura sp. 3N407]|uniref:relaxase/mobilization nuclease domain-containing protein n=1 Tax=Actinomadura sp. 3N407 TaxID=3457423 RepID=UPI003FCE9D1F